MLRNFLISIVLTTGMFSSYVSADDEIMILTEEWPPYNYSDQDQLKGISTEIVRSALKLLGRDYKLVILPSMRTTHTLRNKPGTMMFSMFRTPEREDQFKWIIPLVDASVYLYKRKNDTREISSLEQLKHSDQIICSRHAGLIPDLLTAEGFPNIDKGGNTGIQIYKKLLAGRCDLAASDADLGVRYALKKQNLKFDDVLEQIPFPLFKAELYLVGSHDISEDEIMAWRSALETLKLNGTYNQILASYR